MPYLTLLQHYRVYSIGYNPTKSRQNHLYILPKKSKELPLKQLIFIRRF